MTMVSSPLVAKPDPTANRDQGTSNPAARTRRVLNVPLLVVTLVVLAVVGPSAYFWHSFQVKRSADAFLARANALEEEENFDEAAVYLYRYLRVHPDHVESRIRLAKTYDKTIGENVERTLRAIELYYRAVGLAPQDADLRRRLSELLFDVGRFTSAKEEAKKLVDLVRNDKVGLRISAMSSYGLYLPSERDPVSTEKIIEEFRRALSANPDDVQLAITLARIYRDPAQEAGGLNKAEWAQAADDVIDQMVSNNADNPEAYLMSHWYRQQYGVSGAQEAIDRAIELGPKDFRVLLAAGKNALLRGRELEEQGRVNEATRLYRQGASFYEQAIEVEPTGEQGYLGLGYAYLLQAKPGQSIETWEKGLKNIDKDNIWLNARLASSLIALNRLKEAERYLNSLDRIMQDRVAQLDTTRRTAAESEVNFLKAKWHAAQGNHRDVIALLGPVELVMEKVQGVFLGIAEPYEVQMLKGGAHAALEQWDQAAVAFEKAAKIRKLASQPRELAALARERAGQPGRAGDHFDGMIENAAPESWLAAARARLREQLALPVVKRDWGPLNDQLFNKPHFKLRNSWQLALIRADQKMAQFGPDATDEIMSLLKSAEAAHFGSVELYQRLAVVYERLGKTADVDRAVERVEKLDGKRMAYYMAKSQVLIARRQFDEAEKLLRQGMKVLPAEQRPDLQTNLVQLRLMQGDVAGARQELRTLFEARPTVSVLRQLAELALEEDDLKDTERWEKELHKSEGDDGSDWRYYRARRLLVEANNNPKDPRFLEAIQLQREVENKRRTWSGGYLLKGLIAQQQDKPGDAIDAFETAILLGESRVSVYERLIYLLFQTQQIDKVRAYLARLGEPAKESGGLINVEMEMEWLDGNKERALTLARKAVERQPGDLQALLRLSRALVMADQAKEAETMLRQVVEKAPDDVNAWNGLLSFYLTTRDTEGARKTLGNFPAGAKVSPAQKAYILAQGYELLGDRLQAAKHYEEALRLEPGDATLVQRVAKFHRSLNDLAGAEKLLRRVLTLEPGNGLARRELAEVLVMRGGDEAWKDARRRLEAAGVGENGDPQDRRLLANLAVRRSGQENLALAKKLLEGLVGNPKLAAPGDHITLARIYEGEGAIPAARNQLVDLAARKEQDPQHLAILVDLLLRRDDNSASAENWLDRLKQVDGDSFTTLTLQARWLKKVGRVKEIEPILDALALKQVPELRKESEQAVAAFCANVGNVYSAVEWHENAEKWYRRLMNAAPGQYQPLAKVLVAQGRMTEAIQLCQEKAASDHLGRAALTLSTVVTQGKPTPQEWALADSVLAEAQRQFPNDVNLIYSMGVVRTYQDRPDDAIAFYRKVLEIHPGHVATMNNLAVVLAETGQSDHQKQAIDYIRRAVEVNGRQSVLLDTLGTVLLGEDPGQAIQVLNEAIAINFDDSRYHFHLAVAYMKNGEQTSARKAFAKAVELKLDDQKLSKVEKGMRAELERTLGNAL